MKTLIVSLIFISQFALANNGQGSMGGSQVGTLDSGSVGTMSRRLVGTGQGNMLNSRFRTFMGAGGGGGLRPTVHASKNSDYEI